MTYSEIKSRIQKMHVEAADTFAFHATKGENESECGKRYYAECLATQKTLAKVLREVFRVPHKEIQDIWDVIYEKHGLDLVSSKQGTHSAAPNSKESADMVNNNIDIPRKCHHCGLEGFHEDDSAVIDKHLYCGNCFASCSACDELQPVTVDFHIVKGSSHSGNGAIDPRECTVCDTCYKSKYIVCPCCETAFHKSLNHKKI